MSCFQMIQALFEDRPMLASTLTTFFLSFSSALIGKYLKDGAVGAAELWSSLSYAVVASPPLSLFWYSFLEHFSMFCLVRTAADQLVWQPVMLLYSMLAVGLLQGRSWDDCTANIHQHYVNTLLSGLMFWPLVQYTNQRFITLRYRIIVMSAIAFVWDIFYAVQCLGNSGFQLTQHFETHVTNPGQCMTTVSVPLIIR